MRVDNRAMISHYKVIVGFIDRIAESCYEGYQTILRSFDVKVTVPAVGGGYTCETIRVPYERYSELQEIGGVGGKIRVTQTEAALVLEKEDFILCRKCGDVLLYDEILKGYESCQRKTRGASGYISGQCHIVDNFIRYDVNSIEFCIAVRGRVYDCFVSREQACYTFLRTLYEFARDGKYRNSFHFRGEVQGNTISLTTLEFDNFY